MTDTEMNAPAVEPVELGTPAAEPTKLDTPEAEQAELEASEGEPTEPEKKFACGHPFPDDFAETEDLFIEPDLQIFEKCLVCLKIDELDLTISKELLELLRKSTLINEMQNKLVEKMTRIIEKQSIQLEEYNAIKEREARELEAQTLEEDLEKMRLGQIVHQG